MKQGALSVVAPIRSDRLDTLRAHLDRLGQDLRAAAAGGAHPLSGVSTIHFARWLIVPANGTYEAQLAFESNFDGDEATHVTDLATEAAELVDRLYTCCQGYPERSARTVDARRDYLSAHSLPYGAWHNGHPGLSVQIVRNDVALVDMIQRFVDEIDRRELDAMSPFELRDAIRAHVRAQKDRSPELVIDRVDRGLPSLTAFVVLVAALVLAFLVFLGWLAYVGSAVTLTLLGLVLGVVALGPAYVLYLEDREARTESRWFPIYERAHDEHMLDVVAEEDNQPQNPLSHVVEIKAGRAPVLRFVLWLIEILARGFYFRGALGTITTIHFGRWVSIDQGRRLLFFSNYDGSWESYLGDFVDRSSPWLTAVWSNTEGFPNTTLLFFYGASDEQSFKRWTRSRQIPTQAWYSAYPGLSVFNVQNNAAIRDGLFEDMTEAKTQRWLARL